MAFETMVDLLKDQEMDRLIEPCRRLWAFRQKKNELSRNYKIMKNQRQLMEFMRNYNLCSYFIQLPSLVVL